MGLFTSPVTLNDGVGDRIFAFRSQVFDKKSVVGEYIETAAALSANSVIRVKHDPNSPVPRHLLQRTVFLAPAADATGKLYQVTQNYTIVASSLFTDAELLPENVLFRDALGEANVMKSLLQNLI
jgi:hypothetical protein